MWIQLHTVKEHQLCVSKQIETQEKSLDGFSSLHHTYRSAVIQIVIGPRRIHHITSTPCALSGNHVDQTFDILIDIDYNLITSPHMHKQAGSFIFILVPKIGEAI